MAPARPLPPAPALALVLALAFALGCAPARAQDDFDESLFGGDPEGIVTEVEQDPAADPSRALLQSDTVTLGGSYDLSLELRLDPAPDENDDALSSGLLDLRSRLFVDARPSAEFRAFAKGDLSYRPADGADFDLRELFADVAVADTVFVRAGKQTINWGVGVFFSPANLVNLERVDPEDPDAELAGPAALKAQLPLGTTNLTGYLLTDDFASGVNFDLAARAEFLLQDFEITVGGVLRADGPWALATTAAGAVGEVSVFAEAVLQGDPDKVFVVRDPGAPGGVATRAADGLFASGTLGARYRTATEDDAYTLVLAAQYFYNGLGYDDFSLLQERPQAILALVAAGELRPEDLRERGRHYLAASASAPDLGRSDLTPSLLWLGNLSDGSGIVDASVRYSGFDPLTPTVGYRLAYGAEGAEYAPAGTRHAFRVGVSLRGTF